MAKEINSSRKIDLCEDCFKEKAEYIESKIVRKFLHFDSSTKLLCKSCVQKLNKQGGKK